MVSRLAPLDGFPQLGEPSEPSLATQTAEPPSGPHCSNPAPDPHATAGGCRHKWAAGTLSNPFHREQRSRLAPQVVQPQKLKRATWETRVGFSGVTPARSHWREERSEEAE